MCLPCDEPCVFLENTIELLKNDPRTLLEIYSETKIPYHWLKSLEAGKIKSPSVNRIHYLRSKLVNS